jgi:nucleoside-diphosphate-sugar epimerase
MSATSFASLRLSGVNFDPTYKNLPERWKNPGAKLGTFWSYVDVRDAAESCRLAIEAGIKGHEVFNIGAETSRYLEPTSELVKTYLPETKIKDGMTGHWSGLDSRRARDRLGFAARHLWQDCISPDGTAD